MLKAVSVFPHKPASFSLFITSQRVMRCVRALFFFVRELSFPLYDRRGEA